MNKSQHDIVNYINQLTNLNPNSKIVNACTDITGFGLLGHLYNMLKASNKSAKLIYNSIPIIKGTIELVQENTPGGTLSNKQSLEEHITFDDSIHNDEQILLYDAQTSGGLLISVSSNRAEQLISEMIKNNIDAKIIGEVIDNDNKSSKIIVG